MAVLRGWACGWNMAVRCIIVMGLIWETMGLVKLPPDAMAPSAVFAFGDSFLDTGNNNNVGTPSKCNFPPYGQDFPGGIPTGRFSNGKLISDLLVEELGIKEVLPAYLDPNLRAEDLPTGVCFASGSSGYDPLTPKLLSVISIWKQLELFVEYKEKLKASVGENRSNSIISNSVVLVSLGFNDFANNYFIFRARQLQYDIPSYTDFLRTLASNFTKGLYEVGARRIGVLGSPPVGCAPFERTLAGGATRECVDKYNEAVQLFNSKLAQEAASLNRQLPDSRIVYIDFYNPVLDLIINYQQNRFNVSDRGCCGTGKIEAGPLCNKFAVTCPNASDYVFWDSVHPTQAAYQKLAAPIFAKYLPQFF